jgi:hypothetical protein
MSLNKKKKTALDYTWSRGTLHNVFLKKTVTRPQTDGLVVPGGPSAEGSAQEPAPLRTRC